MWVYACRVSRQLGGSVRLPTDLLLRRRACGGGLEWGVLPVAGGAGSKYLTAAWPQAGRQLIVDGEGQNTQSRSLATLKRQPENNRYLCNIDAFCYWYKTTYHKLALLTGKCLS